MLKLTMLTVGVVLLGVVSCAAPVEPGIYVSYELPDRDALELLEAQEFYSELNLATLLVQADGGTGSGVVIALDLVLTAAHVVSHREVIQGPDGRPAEGELIVGKVAVLKQAYLPVFLSDAEVVKIDDKLDLAILRLKTPWPYTIARLSPTDPYLYQKAWASGHPHGVTDTQVAEGRIQDLWDDGFIRYSSPTTFGNSGGPVFIRSGGKYFVSSIVQRVHVEGFGTAVNHLGLGALPAEVRAFSKEFVR